MTRATKRWLLLFLIGATVAVPPIRHAPAETKYEYEYTYIHIYGGPYQSYYQTEHQTRYKDEKARDGYDYRNYSGQANQMANQIYSLTPIVSSISSDPGDLSSPPGMYETKGSKLFLAIANAMDAPFQEISTPEHFLATIPPAQRAEVYNPSYVFRDMTPYTLMRVVRQHMNLIQYGHTNMSIIRSFVEPAEANIMQIKQRHANALNLYHTYYTHYAAVTANEIHAREQSAIQKAKNQYFSPPPNPNQNIVMTGLSVDNNVFASATKSSLNSIYECLKIHKGKWGYWVMDGPQKGRFVVVNNVNDSICAQGYCLCETVF